VRLGDGRTNTPSCPTRRREKAGALQMGPRRGKGQIARLDFAEKRERSNRVECSGLVAGGGTRSERSFVSGTATSGKKRVARPCPAHVRGWERGGKLKAPSCGLRRLQSKKRGRANRIKEVLHPRGEARIKDMVAVPGKETNKKAPLGPFVDRERGRRKPRCLATRGKRKKEKKVVKRFGGPTLGHRRKETCTKEQKETTEDDADPRMGEKDQALSGPPGGGTIIKKLPVTAVRSRKGREQHGPKHRMPRKKKEDP